MENKECCSIACHSCLLWASHHSFIRGISEAKVAWDILYDTYNSNAPAPPPPVMTTEEEELEMGSLYRAIAQNNWSAARASIDRLPKVLNVDFAAPMDETPLHVAAKFGHLGTVEELLRLVPEEYLEIRYGYFRYTPLASAAAHSGVIPIVACMINKNNNALAIPTRHVSAIPVALAFRCGNNEMGRYLYSVTSLQVFRPENGNVGPEFLNICLSRGEFDIALHLLQRCTELLFAADSQGIPTIGRIAFYLSKSLNKSHLPHRKRWPYHWIGLLHSLISSIHELPGMEKIYKMKLRHAQAAEILNLVCENLTFLNEVKRNMMGTALQEAVKAENVEFLLRLTKASPELSTLATFGLPHFHIFFYAVRLRKAEIFNLFCGFRFKNVVATVKLSGIDNTLLHMAAMLAPASFLNHISGAALQMFKGVGSVGDRGHRRSLNKKGLTPLEFFKENHRLLRAEGEKWMKETATSCSVVRALSITVMFTAAITVPRGNNQDLRYPIFMQKKLFKVFLVSDALSLFSSTTSVLTFLGILTSRYAEEDFLHSLPRKLIIGLSTLFLSIATMMIAFSTTIVIMLQYNSSHLWVTLPVIVLAGVLVTLFVLLQFPLLVEVFSSTYRPAS